MEKSAEKKIAEGEAAVAALEAERAELMERLEFVESLVGPTEAQRRDFQELVLGARAAAVRVRHRGAGIPVRWVGRLDEAWLRSKGLTERDVGLLQGGHIPTADGVLQDVSLLGDPNFRPYDEKSGAPVWDAQGGGLQLTLAEVRDRFGQEVAAAVLRCARELDQFDASRRIGVELPWHPLEDREMTASEIIDLLGAELNAMQSRNGVAPEVRVGTSSTNASTAAMSLIDGVFGGTTTTDSSTPRSAAPVLSSSMPLPKAGASSTPEAEWRRSRADDPDGEYPWSLSDADLRDLLEKPQRSCLVPEDQQDEAAQKEIDEEVQRLLCSFDSDAPSFSSVGTDSTGQAL
jgi:hypothetical protein